MYKELKDECVSELDTIHLNFLILKLKDLLENDEYAYLVIPWLEKCLEINMNAFNIKISRSFK